MHIKQPAFPCFVLSALCLMLAAPLAAAGTASEASSPYRISAEAVQINRPEMSLPTTQQVAATQTAYQLETRYRPQSQPKPLNIVKGAMSTTGLLVSWPSNQLVLGKFSDYSMANPKLTEQPFSEEIALAARAASLDPALVHAVIFVESRYRRSAISARGAIGLMQVLPVTAARYGIKDAGNSPKANLKAGTLYLRDLMHMFDNRLDLALAAYNAGEGTVVKYSWQVPPYRETRQYVLAVMAKYNEWRNVGMTGSVVAGNGIDVNPVLPAKAMESSSVEYLTGTRLANSDEYSAYKY